MRMNALVLDGRLQHQHHIEPVRKILVEELDRAGWTVDSILLHQANIRGCLGCFKCWDTTPGLCIQRNDEAPAIVKKFIQSDLVVFLTPLTFGGYSSELKRIIERMLGLLLPGATMSTGETHHLKRYDRYPSLLALGVAEEQDIEGERIFKALVERHSRNFYPPRFWAEVISVSEENRKVCERMIQIISEEMETVT